MADYIEREAAKAKIREKFKTLEDRIEINEVLNSVPAEDVAPVRRGRWERTPTWWIYCSECGNEPPKETNIATPYCHWCGAQMTNEEETE